MCKISLWSVRYILNQSTAYFGPISNSIEISIMGWTHGLYIFFKKMLVSAPKFLWKLHFCVHKLQCIIHIHELWCFRFLALIDSLVIDHNWNANIHHFYSLWWSWPGKIKWQIWPLYSDTSQFVNVNSINSTYPDPLRADTYMDEQWPKYVENFIIILWKPRVSCCQLCLALVASLWQLPVPSRKTNLASWRLSVLSIMA